MTVISKNIYNWVLAFYYWGLQYRNVMLGKLYRFPNSTLLSLDNFQNNYRDSPGFQWNLSNKMLEKLEKDITLYEYRLFIKENNYGMGEDEFMILWDLIVQSMSEKFSFCEIGVHKGQILALINLLAKRHNKDCVRYGITPLTGEKTKHRSDFESDIKNLHKTFGLDEDYNIIKGLSGDIHVRDQARNIAPFDILYIDGSHEKEDVLNDFLHYLPMIAINGILVVDDSNNNAKCTYGPPFLIGGEFWGIQDVSDVTDEVMNDNTDYEYIGSIIHNRIWRKLR